MICTYNVLSAIKEIGGFDHIDRYPLKIFFFVRYFKDELQEASEAPPWIFTYLDDYQIYVVNLLVLFSFL